jgi:thymidylate kinase
MTRQTVIVELAGPAGVGKTTIRNALNKSNKTMRFTPVPQIRQLRNFPFFLWNSILLLPVFFAVYRNQKQSLTFELVVKLAVLTGWARRLQADHQKDLSVMILDQGPVYMLAELLRHGPTNFRQIVPRWWERVCSDWTHVLDLVICLDSPDAILLQRNRTREKSHGIKKNPDDWAAQFLARSREAQSEVLTSMTEIPGKMKVEQIDTTQSLDETVQRISALVHEMENSN